MTDHIHFGNGTHAAYHDIDLNGSRGPAKVWPDAIVVTAKQIVQQVANVAVVVALRPLSSSDSRTCGHSKTSVIIPLSFNAKRQFRSKVLSKYLRASLLDNSSVICIRLIVDKFVKTRVKLEIWTDLVRGCIRYVSRITSKLIDWFASMQHVGSGFRL